VDAFQESKVDKHFFKILKAIKKRPGMYIYPINLSSLRNFISGYNCSKSLFEDTVCVLSRMSPSFNEWLANKEKKMIFSTGNGWVEIIEFNSKTDQEAFEKFFDYLEEYLAENGIKLK